MTVSIWVGAAVERDDSARVVEFLAQQRVVVVKGRYGGGCGIELVLKLSAFAGLGGEVGAQSGEFVVLAGDLNVGE